MFKDNLVKFGLSLVFLVGISFSMTGCAYIRNLPLVKEKVLEDQKERTQKTEEAVKKDSILRELDDLSRTLTRSVSSRFRRTHRNVIWKSRSSTTSRNSCSSSAWVLRLSGGGCGWKWTAWNIRLTCCFIICGSAASS